MLEAVSFRKLYEHFMAALDIFMFLLCARCKTIALSVRDHHFFQRKKTRNWCLAIWWVLTLLLNFLLLLEFVEKLWPILNRVFSNQYLLFFAVSVSKKNILILKSFFILFILHLVPFYLSTLSSISLHFHFYNII